MNWEIIFIFVIGLFFGSLANVVVLRLNTSEPIFKSRSRCFSCSRKLSWFELIPIFSFVFLRGRCRSCGSKISWQYPAVEFSSGILFLLLFMKIQSNFQFSIFNFQFLNFILAVFFFWTLLIISVYDLRHTIIPNVLVYAAILVSLIYSIFTIHYSLFIIHLLSGLGLFLFFAMLWAVSRGKWMGFGDAKLALAAGLFLGWPESIVALLFSFWLGAIFGLGFVFFKKLKSLKVQIPFGPFLAAGAFIAFLRGQEIISWYLELV